MTIGKLIVLPTPKNHKENNVVSLHRQIKTSIIELRARREELTRMRKDIDKLKRKQQLRLITNANDGEGNK